MWTKRFYYSFSGPSINGPLVLNPITEGSGNNQPRDVDSADVDCPYALSATLHEEKASQRAWCNTSLEKKDSGCTAIPCEPYTVQNYKESHMYFYNILPCADSGQRRISDRPILLLGLIEILELFCTFLWALLKFSCARNSSLRHNSSAHRFYYWNNILITARQL